MKTDSFEVEDSSGDENSQINRSVELKQETAVVSDEFITQINLFLNLALPTIIISFVGQLPWVMSSSFAGVRLGTEHLAALALCNMINLVGKALGLGLLTAFDTLAGKAMGEKNYEEVGFLTQRSVFLCSIVNLFMFFFFMNSKVFFKLFSQPEDVIEIAAEFLKIYAFAFPADIYFCIIQGFYRCQNITFPFSIIIILTTALHYVFLRYFSQIAFAHTATLYSSLALSLGFYQLRWHKNSTSPSIDVKQMLSKEKLYEYLQLGIPGILSMSEWYFWEAQTFLAGSYGTHALAAHAIAYNIVPVSYNIPYSFALAAQTRISTLIAQKRGNTAKKVAYGTLFITGLTGVVIGSLIYYHKSFFITLFLKDDSNSEVIEYLDSVWLIFSSYVVFDALLAGSSGVFRGISKHGKLGVIMVVSLFIFGLPVEFGFKYLTSFGFQGLWIGLWIIYLFMDLWFIISILLYDWTAHTYTLLPS